MNKFNFFKAGHRLYPLRWLIAAVFAGASAMSYYDYRGDSYFINNEKDEQPMGSGMHHK